MAEQQQNNRPERSIRYGAVEAAIWRNQGESGDFHNTTFTRHYKAGEDWKQTDSFREIDLPSLSKLALDSHTVIQELKQDSASAGEGD